MPFTETHTAPKTDSKVTIKFAGLILLRPNGTTNCDIGIHRFAPSHMIQALLIVNKPGLPPTLIRLTTGPLTSDLTITVNPPNTGFRVYTKDDNPFDPLNANNDKLDYRWSVNLFKLNPGIDFFDEGTKPMATLNDGILYTSNLSKEGIKPVLVRGMERKEMLFLAADLSASIELPGQAFLAMSWREFGKPKTLRLPRDIDKNINATYTIVLLNDPPSIEPAAHDELGLYYDVVRKNGQEVPKEERWQLIYENAPKSDEIPCLPIVLTS
jgi:hypothetical protein